LISRFGYGSRGNYNGGHFEFFADEPNKVVSTQLYCSDSTQTNCNLKNYQSRLSATFDTTNTNLLPTSKYNTAYTNAPIAFKACEKTALSGSVDLTIASSRQGAAGYELVTCKSMPASANPANPNFVSPIVSSSSTAAVKSPSVVSSTAIKPPTAASSTATPTAVVNPSVASSSTATAVVPPPNPSTAAPINPTSAVATASTAAQVVASSTGTDSLSVATSTSLINDRDVSSSTRSAQVPIDGSAATLDQASTGSNADDQSSSKSSTAATSANKGIISTASAGTNDGGSSSDDDDDDGTLPIDDPIVSSSSGKGGSANLGAQIKANPNDGSSANKKSQSFIVKAATNPVIIAPVAALVVIIIVLLIVWYLVNQCSCDCLCCKKDKDDGPTIYNPNADIEPIHHTQPYAAGVGVAPVPAYATQVRQGNVGPPERMLRQRMSSRAARLNNV
jgi:hypothetical protein